MSMASINHDVLSLIVSFLDTRDALNLSRTAHRLQQISVEGALAVVILHDWNNVGQFCIFVLADPSRAVCLQHLEIPTPSTLSETSNRTVALNLQHVIRNASRLRYLGLARPYVEEFLSVHHQIPQILSVHASLSSLSLNGVHALALRMLSQFDSQSILQALSLNVMGDVTLTFILRSIARLHHLQRLQLEDVFSSFLSSDQLSPPHPRVRHLRIRTCALPLAHFARAFPNVRTLQMWLLPTLWFLKTDTQTASWDSLDHVLAIKVDSMEQWQINCTVYWLALDLGLLSWRSLIEKERLRKMSPTVLTLWMSSEALFAFCASLVEHAPSLRCLELVLPGTQKDIDCRAWETTISQSLKWLDLFHVQIATTSANRELLDETVFEWVVEGMDRLPSLLARTIPSLRFISLGVEPYIMDLPEADPDRQVRWWRVVDNGIDRTVVPISAAFGEYVLARTHTPDCDYAILANM